jgi:hypothetical protein
MLGPKWMQASGRWAARSAASRARCGMSALASGWRKLETDSVRGSDLRLVLVLAAVPELYVVEERIVVDVGPSDDRPACCRGVTP